MDNEEEKGNYRMKANGRSWKNKETEMFPVSLLKCIFFTVINRFSFDYIILFFYVSFDQDENEFLSLCVPGGLKKRIKKHESHPINKQFQ